MKRFLSCMALGAITAQVWGMISWMALGWHCWDFREFADETPVVQAVKEQGHSAGFYMLPNFNPAVSGDEQKMKSWMQGAKQGPYAFMVLHPQGVNANMGKSMLLGFLMNAVIAAVLVWLLGNLSVTCPKGRTLILGVCGSLGGAYVHFANWNHWKFPLSYSVVGIVDLFLTWALAGAAIVCLSDWCAKRAAA